MSDDLAEQGRDGLYASREALLKRYRASTDPAERETIAASIDRINSKMDKLDLADLLSAASALGDISDELEAVIASAKQRPLDHTFDGILKSFRDLEKVRGKMHAKDALPRASEPPSSGAVDDNKVKRTKNFEEIADEYKKMFESCTVSKNRQDNVNYYLRHIISGKSAYIGVTERFGIPWYFVGIIHGMECGFNFNTHLHNGDALAKKTVNEPKGRPKAGNPPFTWRESAEDALQGQGLDKIHDWGVSRMLFLFEQYNGFGYRNMGLPSPYLWSFSNHYTKGKYVADGKFDPEAVSKQCGAAVILKAGKAQGAF